MTQDEYNVIEEVKTSCNHLAGVLTLFLFGKEKKNENINLKYLEKRLKHHQKMLTTVLDNHKELYIAPQPYVPECKYKGD